MLKTVAKMFMGFLLMLVISVGSAYISYLVTCNIMRQRMEAEMRSVNAAAKENETKTASEDIAEIEDVVILYDYYIVRLEGENLGVYAVADDREEFLYNESIYVKDLSEYDLELLENGVKLQNPSELTGFMEDFTS